MKRIGNLFQRIVSIETLEKADIIASQGKSSQYGVVEHRKNEIANIRNLHQLLVDKKYKTSPYAIFTVHEPKERQVYRLPYFPDRIVHHAIMNVLEPMFVANFTADTYSCIKGKGIHAAAKKVKAALKSEAETKYCLKLDIKKFYPSIDHDILKSLLRRKIKDTDLLNLLDEIIDSASGVPIGNYLSQYFANFYLSYFDHWMKEIKQIKHYFRYADDIVVLAQDKASLRVLLEDIRSYLSVNLKLTVKGNYQVFPVDSRSIDFLGYRFYHTHILLRKSIKQSFARAVNQKKSQSSIASYMGWAKHCNSKHLIKKLFNETV